MAARSYLIRLTDIRDEIAGIRNLTKGANADGFAADWAMKRAVEHALLIIAEASEHIPEELKRRWPEIPWQKIHGLGNMLRHEYRRIDPDVLWSVVTDHLETLDAAVAAMIALDEKTVVLGRPSRLERPTIPQTAPGGALRCRRQRLRHVL